MMIVVVYVLNLFRLIQARRIFANPPHFDEQKNFNIKVIEIPPSGPLKVNNISQKTEEDSTFESEIHDKSKSESEKYFHTNPVRSIGFITEKQIEMLFDTYETYYRLDKKIARIVNDNLRLQIYEIYRSLLIFMHKFYNAKDFEEFRFLRINYLLLQFERKLKILDEIILKTLKNQDQQKNILKLQDDLMFLEKNIFDRLK